MLPTLLLSASLAAASLISRDPVGVVNGTADNSTLKTWWHGTGEINSATAVADGNVRQSHMYTIQIATAADASEEIYYNSFVYEAIPRNGNGNILIPGDPSSTTTDDDGITIEADIGNTMAWTSFLYGADVSVMVSRRDGTQITLDDVVIRPTTLDLDISAFDGSLYVTVPYSSAGLRFSIEFADDLFEFHDGCDGTNCGYVQNVTSDGWGYVESYTDTDTLVGVEPLNSLLIFASPFPSSDLVPDATSSDTLVVEEGLVTGLDATTASTVYFSPGVYYMSSTAHAVLSSSVDWVYLAPGAYVKGAIQFQSSATMLKATGYGVLSGEQYVYQANTASGYTNNGSNEDSLRIWSGYSSYDGQQTFVLQGPTTANPPFNSVDFTGDLSTISIDAFDYKQVGAWFGQTDGITLYPGSTVVNTFYHSNDDTIKTYNSNLNVESVVIWKGHTAPAIQFGWASRNIANITVTDVSIIHSRYNTNGSHPSLIGGNQIYQVSEDEIDTADLANTISNFTITNLRSEGISGNLFRICPLENFENFVIDTVWIEEFSNGNNGIYQSEIPMFMDTDGDDVTMSGFIIKSYYVGDTQITFEADNWGVTDLGGLNIASPFLESGGLTIE